MRMNGKLYEDLDRESSDFTFTVTEAIVTPTRLAVDWRDQTGAVHLEASSNDGGQTYTGTYGWPRLNPDWHIKTEAVYCCGRNNVVAGTLVATR